MKSKDNYIKLLENTLMKSIDNMAQLKNELNQDFDYYDYVCELGMNNSQALEFLDLFGDDTLYRQAKKDYLKLKEIVENYNGTIEELCKELGGHNYDEDEKYFDLNYGRLCSTVKEEDDKIILSEWVDIYDRYENVFMSCMTAEDLLEYGDE